MYKIIEGFEFIPQVVHEEAVKQTVGGPLATHYSVGWNWGRDSDGGFIQVTWNGERKNVTHNFIDIFDSTDIQVIFVIKPAI